MNKELFCNTKTNLYKVFKDEILANYEISFSCLYVIFIKGQ